MPYIFYSKISVQRILNTILNAIIPMLDNNKNIEKIDNFNKIFIFKEKRKSSLTISLFCLARKFHHIESGKDKKKRNTIKKGVKIGLIERKSFSVVCRI